MASGGELGAEKSAVLDLNLNKRVGRGVMSRGDGERRRTRGGEERSLGPESNRGEGSRERPAGGASGRRRLGGRRLGRAAVGGVGSSRLRKHFETDSASEASAGLYGHNSISTQDYTQDYFRKSREKS